MEENVVLLTLEKIFRGVFGNDSLIITKETSSKDIDEWNSLNHMILVSEIESAFSVKFKLKELNKMRNIGDMIGIIISKL